MILVDSSGWLEFLVDGPLAKEYAEALLEPGEVLTPTVVFYEVYKWVRRERRDETAMVAAAQMSKTRIAVLDRTIALTAADAALEYGLAMADAIVYATGRVHGTSVMTSDRDFEGLPGVMYLPK